MLRRIVLPLLLATSSLTAIPQTATPTATIKGTITDELGAVIPRAHVFVHANKSIPEEASDTIGFAATTDMQGKFQLDLPPGAYDIIVASHPWKVYATTVLLKPKTAIPLKIKLFLPKDTCDWPDVNCDTFK